MISGSGVVASALTVDANVLISALLGGQAARLLQSPRRTFFTTIRTTWEVARYVPRMAARLAERGIPVTEAELHEDLRSLPVVALPDAFYRNALPKARALIGPRDPDDVDILALTLRLKVPLWTHDRDFEAVPGIRVVTTAELLASL